MALDVVYPVRDGDDNEFLRYSLRSLVTNFNHGNVWIVGYKPDWVTNVGYIPGNSRGRRANIYNNLRAAMNCDDLTSKVIVFNDDFYITERVTTIPAAHRGPLADHIAELRPSPWRESLNATHISLAAHGIENPDSYELHTPMPVWRTKIADTLAMFEHVTPANPPQWRTLYGNMNKIRAHKTRDVKARSLTAPTRLRTPFHSTSPRTFGQYQTILADMFPTPCRYETREV